MFIIDNVCNLSSILRPELFQKGVGADVRFQHKMSPILKDIATQSHTGRSMKKLNAFVELQIFVKHLLSGRIFIGHYRERRYVEVLETYRDVVIISKSEVELKRDLDIVKSDILATCNCLWIGITGPGAYGAVEDHALWVKLQGIPYGLYWFQLRRVKFSDEGEVIAILKWLRKASDVDESIRSTDSSHQQRSMPTYLSHSRDDEIGYLLSNFIDKYDVKSFIAKLRAVFTIENAKNALLFLSVLFITLLTGLLHLTRELGLFSLSLFREFTYLLHVLTPVFLSIVDFLNKCVGGFYILIAMMWRNNQQTEMRTQILAQRRLTYTMHRK